jgi:hypothetical protein
MTEQLAFELPVTEGKQQRRRGTRRRTVRTAVPEPKLMDDPTTDRCGFCGQLNTLHGQATACRCCGSMLLRREGEE